MKLHVLLYRDTSNPEALPGEWPAKVREVPDVGSAPVAPWIEMTLEEYRAYRTARAGEVPVKITQAELDANAQASEATAIRPAIAVFKAGTATNAQIQRAIAYLLKQSLG